MPHHRTDDGGATLSLAVVRHLVTAQGDGCAFCDSDFLARVASGRPGTPQVEREIVAVHEVHALTGDGGARIVQRIDHFNSSGDIMHGTLLKNEHRDVVHGAPLRLLGLGISSRRYCLPRARRSVRGDEDLNVQAGGSRCLDSAPSGT